MCLLFGFQWKEWHTTERTMLFSVTPVYAGWKLFTTLILQPSYLGTSESPPLNVVGSSSNMEEMSFPSGTDTRVYMTLSWTFLKRARRASCSESSWREKSKSQNRVWFRKRASQIHKDFHFQQLRWSATSVSRSLRICDRVTVYYCGKISRKKEMQWIRSKTFFS